ncbi:hypothetical protein V8E53_000751 [Lactarius tabidus]
MKKVNPRPGLVVSVSRQTSLDDDHQLVECLGQSNSQSAHKCEKWSSIVENDHHRQVSLCTFLLSPAIINSEHLDPSDADLNELEFLMNALPSVSTASLFRKLRHGVILNTEKDVDRHPAYTIRETSRPRVDKDALWTDEANEKARVAVLGLERNKYAEEDNHSTLVPNLSNIQGSYENGEIPKQYSKSSSSIGSSQKPESSPDSEPSRRSRERLVGSTAPPPLYILRPDLDSERVLPHMYRTPVVVIVFAHTINLNICNDCHGGRQERSAECSRSPPGRISKLDGTAHLASCGCWPVEGYPMLLGAMAMSPLIDILAKTWSGIIIAAGSMLWDSELKGSMPPGRSCPVRRKGEHRSRSDADFNLTIITVQAFYAAPIRFSSAHPGTSPKFSVSLQTRDLGPLPSAYAPHRPSHLEPAHTDLYSTENTEHGVITTELEWRMLYPELPSRHHIVSFPLVHNSVLKGQALVPRVYVVPLRRRSAHLYGTKVKVAKGKKVVLNKAPITRQSRRTCRVSPSRLVVSGAIGIRRKWRQLLFFSDDQYDFGIKTTITIGLCNPNYSIATLPGSGDAKLCLFVPNDIDEADIEMNFELAFSSFAPTLIVRVTLCVIGGHKLRTGGVEDEGKGWILTKIAPFGDIRIIESLSLACKRCIDARSRELVVSRSHRISTGSLEHQL